MSRDTWRAAAVYLVLTIAMAWPLSIHPATHLLNYDSDAKLIHWIVRWDIHAFTTQPLHLFDANIFAPLPNTLAYAEHLIGSALLAAPIVWATDNTFLAINLIALASIWLSGLGTYVLARRLGASPTAAFLGGLVFAFAAPRFFRLGQLQLTTIHWIPFCLASLHAYLDHGRVRDLRIAAWLFSLQALSGGHGAVFLAVCVAALLLFKALLGEPLRLVQRLRDLGVTGALAVVPIVLVFLPYVWARGEAGLVRTLAGWRTPFSNFFASPSHLHQWLAQWLPASWREAPDAYLFPGYLALILPLAGAAVWMWRRRTTSDERPWRARYAWLYAAIAAACFALLLGPPWGPWQWAYDLPLLNFIRVPTRFSIVVVLCLGVLTALAFDEIVARWTPSRRAWMGAGLAVLLVAEYWAGPLAAQPYPRTQPAIDRWLATQPGPMVIAEGPMPTDPGDYGLQNGRNANFMLHTTVHWHKTVNGFSGVLPDTHQRLYEAMAVFPSDNALTHMRSLGVTHVVYHADFTDPAVASAITTQFAPWQHALRFVHQEADGRVYEVRGK
jgi:hypothetical protein